LGTQKLSNHARVIAHCALADFDERDSGALPAIAFQEGRAYAEKPGDLPCSEQVFRGIPGSAYHPRSLQER